MWGCPIGSAPTHQMSTPKARFRRRRPSDHEPGRRRPRDSFVRPAACPMGSVASMWAFPRTTDSKHRSTRWAHRQKRSFDPESDRRWRSAPTDQTAESPTVASGPTASSRGQGSTSPRGNPRLHARRRRPLGCAQSRRPAMSFYAELGQSGDSRRSRTPWRPLGSPPSSTRRAGQ